MSHPARIAICVNPMAGRDVRRLAARATNMTHEAKRDIVARVAAGADAVGVRHIHVAQEPFRIATAALSLLPLKAKVHVAETPLTHDARDTEAAVTAFLDAGVTTIVTLGGDGTNRAVARVARDINLVPLSVGTNNVFPTLAEPTVAGIVAGLVAAGRFDSASGYSAARKRCKLLHARLSNGASDVGLVDAALLAGDVVGNMLPFDADRLEKLFLTRAEPDAIGTSAIGGFVDVVEADDDCGLLVELGGNRGGRLVNAPLSPGLFSQVEVVAAQRIPLDTPVLFRGQGVLALDGDRDYGLGPRDAATLSIRRDGPWVIDVGSAMRLAVRAGMMDQ